MEKKKISVIMPVYNAAEFLDEAILSILNQTYTNFEFLIFNDGSTDASKEIIEKYVKIDSRIIFFNQEHNTGYISLLNKGIQISKGEYVARMDADDVSLSNRFEKQIKYLDTHPHVAVLGSSCYTIKEKVIEKGWILKATPEETRVHFLFTNYIIHPSVIMRRSQIISLPYREEYMPAEDFDLWSRVLEQYDIYSLSKPLLMYRIHGSNISILRKNTAYIHASAILKRQLEHLGLKPKEEEVELHHQISDFKTQNIPLEKIKSWFILLWNTNLKTYKYPPHILLSTILGRWYIICKTHPTLSFFGKRFYAFKLFIQLIPTFKIFPLILFLNLSIKRFFRYTFTK